MAGIMIQGTASSAGKSLITTAFCRIFSNDGLRVKPFKSQNMSLNSYVTMEGLEMGRAQVLQAAASRILPSADMNPILLKPTSDRKSQVILRGKAYKNMDAVDYFEFKNQLRPMIKEVYQQLEQSCDVVVIEGAGSPAEINLKQNDIVNMGMAEMAQAPVILVADIDKGGVFASIYGTVMLLEPQERSRIKGVLINKFRGDKSIVQSGITMLEGLINIPVVGVIPYMNINLDEEDGASEFNRLSGRDIDICVIKLPRISNFTDCDGFKFDEDVSVRYVTSPMEIGNADMLIIPGSKNTIEDMRWLKRNGFTKEITDFKGIVFGLCGGYQMMGKTIIDQEGWEVNPGDQEEGLGIFNTTTIFKGDKITTNIEGSALGNSIYGYEIHAGRTSGNENPFVEITLREGRDVCCKDGDMKDNRYYGTYIHGIFDSNGFREYVLNAIRRKKSLKEKSSIDLRVKREEELEKLASIVKDNVDMDYIYSLIVI